MSTIQQAVSTMPEKKKRSVPHIGINKTQYITDLSKFKEEQANIIIKPSSTIDYYTM